MGGVPPNNCANAEPSVQVPHDALLAKRLTKNKGGWVMTKGVVFVHPALSVTATR